MLSLWCLGMREREGETDRHEEQDTSFIGMPLTSSTKAGARSHLLKLLALQWISPLKKGLVNILLFLSVPSGTTSWGPRL